MASTGGEAPPPSGKYTSRREISRFGGRSKGGIWRRSALLGPLRQAPRRPDLLLGGWGLLVLHFAFGVFRGAVSVGIGYRRMPGFDAGLTGRSGFLVSF